MNELDEKLQALLVTRSAGILKCDESEIRWEDDIDEYGFDSMGVIEVTSLDALSGYLKKKYYPLIEKKLL